jgi:hypothetical protein
LLIEVEVYLERFLFLLRVGVFISSGSYSYPSGSCRSNMINAISLEEELGRAQSNPTMRQLPHQVRYRAQAHVPKWCFLSAFH